MKAIKLRYKNNEYALYSVVASCYFSAAFSAHCSLAFLAMMFAISGNISVEVGCFRVTKIRGSICAIAYGRGGPTVIIWIFLGYVVPGIVTMVMSYMTKRTVRKSVIEMDNDHSVRLQSTHSDCH